MNDISQGDNSNQPFLTGINIEQINDYQSDCKYSMQECQVSRITAKNGLLYQSDCKYSKQESKIPM